MRWHRRARHWARTKFAPLIRENWYRDVGLIIVCGLLFFGWRGQNNVLDDVQKVQRDQRHLLHEQKKGRRAAVDIMCAATSAVIDAGRATILGGAASLDPEFAANLERLGYPPEPVRERQARKAAGLYARAISRRVEQSTGVEGVVRRNGTLNCKRLAVLSRVD